MKIKEGYMLRTVAGQHIVVPVGQAAQTFNGMITLNDSGAFLWQAMLQETNRKELIAKLLQEYDVDSMLAGAGVDSFLYKIREAKLIDD